MSDQTNSNKYDYKTGRGDPSAAELATEMAASFVPGLNVAQALRDYKKSSEDKDTVGQVMSALGIVPGLGGAAKAALMVGALRKDLRLVNSSMKGHIKPGTSELLPNLRNPSLGIYKGDINPEYGPFVLAPKPGKFDPAVDPQSRIYQGDAASPQKLGQYADWFRENPTHFKSFKEFEEAPHGANWLGTRDQNYSEVKRPGRVALTPENFVGMAVPSPGLADYYQLPRGHSDTVIKALKNRGLKPEMYDDPSELADIVDYLQGLRK